MKALLVLLSVASCFAQGWTQLSNTTMRTNSTTNICPEDNFQPPGGGMPAYGFSDFCGGVVDSWNTAVVDTKRNRLLMMGGGHANYHGNETYSLDITAISNTAACTGTHPCETNVSVPALRRLNDPGIFTLYGGGCYDTPFTQYPTEYGGPSPVTVHTFGAEVYLPKADKVFAFWAGPDFADCIQYFHVWLLNLGALDSGSRTPWEKKTPSGFDMTTITVGGAPAYAFCVLSPVAVNESVDCLWGANGWTFRYDTVADSWTQLSAYNSWVLVNNAPTAVVDPDRKLVYFIGSDYTNAAGTGRIMAWDPANPTAISDWTSSTTGCADLMGFPYPAVQWDPSLHRVVGFVPSQVSVDIRIANAQVVIFDPATRTCVVTPQLGTPPTPNSKTLLSQSDGAANHGIFGHFSYMPGIGKYVWYDDSGSNAYTFTLNATPTNGLGSSTLTCVDRDGDGYGTGPGCTGPDADDQDVAVHTGAQLVSKWTTLKLGLAHLGYAPAHFWYLSSTGSDSATCTDTTGSTNISTPCATWAHIRPSVVAGDIIIWRGGTYSEQCTSIVSGTSGNPVIYMSYPGELAIFSTRPSGFDLLSVGWAVFDGFRFTGNGNTAGVQAGSNNNIVFRHIDSSGNQWGLDAGGDLSPYQALVDFTIEDSAFHDNDGAGGGQHGIYLTSHGGTLAKNILVRRNLLYNNDYTGMQFNGKARNLVQEQNITYNNWLAGFSWENGVSNSRHLSNLSINDGQGGLVISNYDGNEGLSQCGVGGTDVCNCGTPNKASICADDQINNVVDHYSVYLTGKRYPDGLGSCSGGTEATCNPAIQVARQSGCTTSKCITSNMGSNTFRNIAIFANGVDNNYPPIQFQDITGVTYLSSSTFQNIIAYKAGLAGVLRYGPPDGSHNYTCATWPTGTLSNCLNTNPLFVAASATYWNAPTSFNLRLTRPSPAKATGTTVLNYALYDLLGTPFTVAAPNIGAYEGSAATGGGTSFGSKAGFGGKSVIQ